jgi:hypothetical protein
MRPHMQVAFVNTQGQYTDLASGMKVNVSVDATLHFSKTTNKIVAEVAGNALMLPSFQALGLTNALTNPTFVSMDAWVLQSTAADKGA